MSLPYHLIPGPGDYAPPEDGPTECEDCGGTGDKPTAEDDFAQCPTCEGCGWLDPDGEPFEYDPT